MKKQKPVKRKAVGRSSEPLMAFRPDAMTRAAVVKWAENQPDKPTLAEAIRQLVRLGLSARAAPRRISQARSKKANTMAASQLDRLADPSATLEEQASRKHRLLRGPEEFRGVRVDRPKAGSRGRGTERSWSGTEDRLSVWSIRLMIMQW
jgi:hypothetical protein